MTDATMPPDDAGKLFYELSCSAWGITPEWSALNQSERDQQRTAARAYAAQCLAAVAEDAERYRVLKKCFEHPMQRQVLARALGVDDRHFEPSLDAAIDNARGKKQ